MRDVDLEALPLSAMAFVEPMRPKLVSVLPEGSNWQYEIKWDGYRALAIRTGGKSALVSRRNNSFTSRFPSIVAGLRPVEDGSILDGEIVALDAQGRPSFNLLQYQRVDARSLVYFVFDLLAFRGRDVRRLPLAERRGLLEEILKRAGHSVRGTPVFDGAPGDLIRAVKAERLEGIVAKRVDSRYESTGRSGAWVKFKVNQSQELVVGGYRIGDGTFENLAVGFYDGRDQLVFVAKIRNGFAPDAKPRILERLRALETRTCPFNNLPQRKTGTWDEGLTAEEMSNYQWVRPELVAEVEFAEWTLNNHLRHARFVALRAETSTRPRRFECRAAHATR